jgi:tyrosinase
MTRRLIIAAVLATLLVPAAAAADQPRVRRDVAVLTAKEKRDLVDAFHALKRAKSPFDPMLSWYDQFVEWHVGLNHCEDLVTGEGGIWGHGGPMFLPWHRQYALLLEDALREVSGKPITLPYWDWTSEASTEATFSNDLMGGSGDPAQGYALTEGPFRRGEWELHVDNDDQLIWRTTSTKAIHRKIADPDYAPELPPASDIEAALEIPTYDVAPWNFASKFSRSFRNFLEGVRDNEEPRHDVLGATKVCGPDQQRLQLGGGKQTLHNIVHDWVAGRVGVTQEGATLVGTMGVPLAAPNDPVFWLLHANVDRIWAQWQERHPESTYLPTSGFRDNNAGDRMHPFASTPRDVESIAALGYSYAPPGRRGGPPGDAAATDRAAVTTRQLCDLPGSS